MPIRFASPLFLLLLVALIPLFFIWCRRLRSLAPGRRRMVIWVRALLFLLLALTVAELEWVRISNKLGVIFALDVSNSIPNENEHEARDFVLNALTQMNAARDEAGLVVFGERASLEEKLGDLFPAEQLSILSVPGREQTNVAAAIRLSLAAFPPGPQRRIVLLSDGNETLGSAAEAARGAVANQAVIDVAPLRYRLDGEVKLEKIDLPPRVSLGEPFDLRVIGSSQRAGPAVIRLLKNGVPVAEAQVDLVGDEKQAFTFRVDPSSAGFHTYEAHIEAPGDINPTNNRAHGFTYVAGEPRVLLVSDDPREDGPLQAALLAERFQVDVTTPAGIPGNLSDLQTYDGVIFSNVPADAMTRDQMRLLQRGIHDLGIGLLMIGGPDTMGAGGFIDSPIEEAMPVEFDIHQQQVLPNGALAIILHTCEIPDGNHWAREITVAALNVLSRQDYMGVLDFDYTRGEQWVFPMQRVHNKPYLRRLVYQALPGDMPAFDGPLAMALTGLAGVEAMSKRLIIISDGDPARPSRALLDRAVAMGVNISTILIFPHSGSDEEMMEGVADYTGGTFYYPNNPNALPRIFIREARMVRKSLVIEEEFVPAVAGYSEVIGGLFDGTIPPLLGYVATSRKQTADMPLVTAKGDPLLAHWRHGLGKTMVFTSDAKARWAVHWLPWDAYVKFWSQAVRWILRTTSDENFQINADVIGTQGRVVVDALDDEGNFRNLLELRATVISPDLETEVVALRQTGPGRYEAVFDAEEPGSYMVSLTPDGRAEGGAITSGVSVSYSAEYAAVEANESLLFDLADITGGRILEMGDFGNVFTHDLPRGRQMTPLWPLLLALAALLLPFDIFVRRVLLSPVELVQGIRWSAEKAWSYVRPSKAKDESDETMSALLRTKQETRDAQEQEGIALPEEVLKQMRAGDGGEEPLRGEPSKPAPGAPAQDKPDAKPDVTPSQEHTQALLKAKERARSRTRRPNDKDKP